MTPPTSAIGRVRNTNTASRHEPNDELQQEEDRDGRDDARCVKSLFCAACRSLYSPISS